MLTANPRGHYHFLEGIEPYSSGAVADPGFEVVHSVFLRPFPWREGFERIDDHLRVEGRDRWALCGVELRCPAPMPMGGFIDFNDGYRVQLEAWDLLVNGRNPIARTNVAPVLDPPSETAMHGFSYTMPSRKKRKTLVIAGAGELRSGVLDRREIVRRGDTGPDAMLEKAGQVMTWMEDRLTGLEADWEAITTVDVYCVHDVDPLVRDVVWERASAAARQSVRWYHARPPVEEIEFEMDMRGVCREVVL